MKVTVLFVASFLATAFAHASAPSTTEIQFTLSAAPSFSLDGTTPSPIPNPWGTLHKKLPSYQPHRQLFDTPGSATRLQLLRFQAGATGNLLPALNPELRKQK